jgi:RNA polymerase sigma-70 factor (ECF subfamily)
VSGKKQKYLRFSDSYSLYTNHLKEILAYSNHFVYNIDDAQNLTHDIFCKAFEAIKKKKISTENSRAWLFKIARNHCINIKKKKTLEKKYAENKKNAFQEYITNSSAFLENKIIDKIMIQNMKAYIYQEFSENEIHIFELKFFHGFKQKKIAYILDINPMQVSRILTNVLNKLQKKFPDIL